MQFNKAYFMISRFKYFSFLLIIFLSSNLIAQSINITSKGSNKQISPKENDFFAIAIASDSIPFDVSHKYYRGKFLKDSASFLILKPTYAFSKIGDKRTCNRSKNMTPLTLHKDQIYGIEYRSGKHRKINNLSKLMIKFSIIGGLVLAPAFAYDLNQKEINSKRYYEYLGVSLGSLSIAFITQQLTKKKGYYFKENEKNKRIWTFE